jgi:hypothetical protein
METITKPKTRFYVIAPFNSKMILDYSSLIGKYDKFRKLLSLKLQEEYPNQILIEKFANEQNPIENVKNWMKQEEELIQEPVDDLLFKGTGGSGATKRDKSVITININQGFEMPLDIVGIDIFDSPPTLFLETISFHEYGIGMIYCRVNIEPKQDLLNIEQIEPKKMVANLLDNILRNPELLKTTESVCNHVFEAYKEVLKDFEIRKSLMTYKDLFDNQKSHIPLWGHIVLVRNKLSEDEIIPIDAIMKKIIDVSHPDGAINFSKGTEGFVHIGWGNSLWAGLNNTEFKYAKETLRYLEIEWRTLQVFNDILYKRLNQLASYQTLQKRRVKRTVRWINKLRIEMELYSLNKQNFLQNLAPFAHFIYNESIISWRNSQMEEFFIDKLDAFQYLHERGKERLQELSDTKINNILFIFTCLSLISTFIDGLMFVFAENIAETLAFRLFLLIFPPIAFIILIVIIIERFIGSRK